MCTAEHMPHLHLQRSINRCPGSSPPTLYTPPVKPALPGEPVPELLIQSKYETSCTFEVHLHVSHVYFYFCHSHFYNFYLFLLFYDGIIVIKIDSLQGKNAWTAHVKCAEQADNRELRKKRRNSSSFVLFVVRIILEARHV